MFEIKATVHMDPGHVIAEVQKAAVPRLMKCGYLVEAEAKRLLSHTERHYGTNADGKEVRFFEPSAMGLPPNLRTGNLRASIRTQPSNGTVVVGPTLQAWYGKIHEFGGKFHPARPFMRPALLNCREKFPALFFQLDFEK